MDLLPLWAGQSANLSTCTDVSAFLSSLVEEVSASPGRSWSGAPTVVRPHMSGGRSGV